MLCHTILYYSLLYYALVCYAISHLSDKNKTLAIISTYKYVQKHKEYWKKNKNTKQNRKNNNQKKKTCIIVYLDIDRTDRQMVKAV